MSPISARSRAPHFAFTLLALTLLVGAPVSQAADSSGYLGIQMQDLDSSMAKALQLDEESGVLISEVVEDSPAEKAGLEDGDVILRFDGKDIESAGDLMKAVRKSNAGDEVELKVLRGGKKKSFDVTLGEREDNQFAFQHRKLKEMLHERNGEGDFDIDIVAPDSEDFPGEENVFFFGGGGDHGFLGIQLEDVNEQLAEYFDVDGGVLVTEVVEDSPAAEAGLKAGDVIVKLDGDTIEDGSALREWMSETEAEQKVEVEVSRKGDRKRFDVTLGEAPEHEVTANIRYFDDNDHFSVPAPRVLMKRMPHFGHGGRHGEDNVWFQDGDEGERSIVIERHGEEMDELRGELKELREELKKIREDLKK